MSEIAFTKVDLPYGWLGNMSPHIVKYQNQWYRTAESLFHVDEWTWLYREFGFTGDYEFIFFE